jgi:tetratricopeptide (TPR) repeat protein
VMTRGRAAAAGLAAVVAGAVAAYAGWTTRSQNTSTARHAVDSNVVAVLPFRINGGDPVLADLRDWIQDLLVARLTGEGSPRALDPRQVSEALRRTVTASEGDLSPDVSRRLGDQLGAGLLLRGEVAGTPVRLSLTATLVSVPSGAIQAQARVQGAADSLPYVVDRLTARLLAIRAVTRPDDLAVLSSTSLAALRAYLAGRAAYSRGLVREAEEYFETALSLDPTFTPAGLGVATLQTSYWLWRGDQGWQADAIWAQRHRMTPADRALLVAYLGPHWPDVSTYSELIAAAEQAVRVGPDQVEAWYILGHYLRRFGPDAGVPDVEARAVAALRRALALDSTHAPTLDNLILLAAVAGDTAAVRHYSRLYFAHNPNGLTSGFLRWLTAVALTDTAARMELRRQFARMEEINLWRIIAWGQEFGGAAVDDADYSTDVLLRNAEAPGARGMALRNRVRLLLNRGRPTEASRVLSEVTTGSFAWVEQSRPPDFRVLAALYWDGDVHDAAAAVRELEAQADSPLSGLPPFYERLSPNCSLAHWRAGTGDLEGARAALVRMKRGPPPRNVFVVRAAALCVASVDAMIAAGRHEPQAAARLERLDSLLRDAGCCADPLFGAGNLIAARLHEEGGDLQRALDAVRRIPGVFLSTQRREEGRLAALIGDRPAAIRAYRLYIDLRSDPEPSLRPEVERVRAELERLERGDERSRDDAADRTR